MLGRLVVLERVLQIDVVMYKLRGHLRVVENRLQTAGFLSGESALDDQDAAFDGVAEFEKGDGLGSWLLHFGFDFAVEFAKLSESFV